MPDLLPDLLLAPAVVWVAWHALTGRDLFRSVMYFIAFGLLLSIVWVRLAAPDIALAEAAIGTGLTGALLLDAVGQTRGEARERGPERRSVAWPTALAVLLLAGGLVMAYEPLRDTSGGLAREAAAHLEPSGVSNPVTAVLLNFRAYDTLLEVAVLLLGALGLLVLQGRGDLSRVPGEARADPVLSWLVRLVLPVVLVVGAHLLLIGSRAPGGAFQSAVVVGGGLILLLLAGRRSVTAVQGRLLAAALLLGLATFLAAAAVPLLAGERFLQLRGETAGRVILAVEAALAVSLAVALAALFAGARPRAGSAGEER